MGSQPLHSSDPALSARPSPRICTPPVTPSCCAGTPRANRSRSGPTTTIRSCWRDPCTPIPPRSTVRLTWCSSPSRTPRTSRPAPGWRGCATSTRWCVRCRTASNRSNGWDGSARRRRSCRRPCGSRRRRSQKAGCGCAPSRGWCCRTREAAATLAELLRGAGVTVELDPDFSHRRVAQAAGQRRGRRHGVDRTARGHVPPRRRGGAGVAAISPSAWPWRAPTAPTSATR